jgi:ADP-ribose pyrophosphatase YjhB (NUDIX family)
MPLSSETGEPGPAPGRREADRIDGLARGNAVNVNALVLFTDARGFTDWANNPEVFARLDQFAGAFSGVLRKVFPKKRYFLSPQRGLYPGLLEGCGGQLAASETFAEGVRRHFRLEMGIDVRVLEDFHCFYVIRVPNEKVIPGIRFQCERVGEEEPQSKNHSEVRWLTETQFRALPGDQFVPALKEQVIQLLDQYKQRGSGR